MFSATDARLIVLLVTRWFRLILPFVTRWLWFYKVNYFPKIYFAHTRIRTWVALCPSHYITLKMSTVYTTELTRLADVSNEKWYGTLCIGQSNFSKYWEIWAVTYIIVLIKQESFKTVGILIYNLNSKLNCSAVHSPLMVHGLSNMKRNCVSIYTVTVDQISQYQSWLHTVRADCRQSGADHTT